MLLPEGIDERPTRQNDSESSSLFTKLIRQLSSVLGERHSQILLRFKHLLLHLTLGCHRHSCSTTATTTTTMTQPFIAHQRERRASESESECGSSVDEGLVLWWCPGWEDWLWTRGTIVQKWWKWRACATTVSLWSCWWVSDSLRFFLCFVT